MEICNFLYEESVICEMKVLFVKREAVRKIPSAGKVWIEISYTSNNAKIVFFWYFQNCSTKVKRKVVAVQPFWLLIVICVHM